MHRRRIGSSGPIVAAIGLGCMGMSQFYGERDDEQSGRLLDAAFDMGVDFVDTSDVYGGGHNERLIGAALRGRRNSVVLATKFGVRQAGGEFVLDGSPPYVRVACEASLERLGVDHIDLYYLHRLDPSVPVEETVGAMARLVEQGKVLHLGLSEVGPETLERAARVHPIAALQSEYSIWTRDPEAGVLDACRRLGIGFAAFSPLGRGFLTGSIGSVNELSESDRRRVFPRFQSEYFEQNLQSLAVFVALARELEITPAQLSLAWLLSRSPDIVPIPGTKRLERLAENLAAAEIDLPESVVKTIDRLSGPGAFIGERFQPSDMALIGR